ncbi:penicillin-binding protein 2 [Suilimivivens aceti]|uniref:Penicillin-binding protein 2 n=1 Tax=Suilimivivens aceti TaxID=2981774 RepID=A0ABT2T1G6_9FIRM|nr:penicillin-binding protein 2 [Suilimivivens aceti]MCU6744093.1 penicillin-binding protein 2 [Suilimivivens aceti]SCH54398.1 Penicillin-binding protein 2X [uncultured Clostridium sp.]
MGRGKSYRKFTIKMQKKLVVLFIAVLLAFAGLFYQLYRISRDNGEQYKKQVLSQQRYDSTTIPYKRGTILDANGSVLATSEKVYNVILDSVAISEKEEYLEPTLSALQREFGIDTASIRDYIEKNKETSRYHVLAKRLSYSEISDFLDMQNEEGSQIKGIWFDEEYKRVYPGNSLACDVIGFTTADNRGNYGLEEYYNDVLSGIPGREYGYLNDDSDLERKTIAAEDGNSLVTTIDANIQSIVEKYLLKFNEEYKDNFRPGNGAENVGCIIMKVDSGEILAMANYPNFDLNDTRNTDALMGMPLLDEKGNKTGEYLTEENMDVLDDEEMLYQHLDALWKNYCISSTYEPGSVAKPFTVAAGVESGKITGTETYNCEGSLEIGGWPIRCHNRYGDGLLTVQEGIERSCNVVMMKIGQAMGTDTFVKFQHIFNFGLKTNIDLQGEARTASLIYTKDTMGSTEMATNTFGQSFNVTMIQMITGFCSLINGGYYYEPHMVSKIVSPSGATVQNIEPRVLKQTISEDTSDMIREYCNTVVTGEHGTGKTARPAGYMIGGKTGTAETLPRKNGQYVVSFMGYAPADDPQIAIYVVVDRPNVQYQDDAKFATRIVRGILTEVLPYMGIFMTEELSDSEREELEALQIEIRTAPAAEEEAEEGGDTTEEGTGEENGEDTGTEGEEETEKEEVWKSFPIDPATGYAVDPNTGDMVDPVTGAVIGGSYDENAEEPDASPSPEASADPEGDTGQ